MKKVLSLMCLLSGFCVVDVQAGETASRYSVAEIDLSELPSRSTYDLVDILSLKVPGLQVEDDIYDLDIGTNLSMGLVRLGNAEPAVEANPWVRFDPGTFRLEIDYLKYGADTVYVDMSVVDNGTSIDFTDINSGIAYPIGIHKEWTIGYKNIAWPDDNLYWEDDLSVNWGPYTGEVEDEGLGKFKISIGGGATDWNVKWLGLGKFSGTGDHLGQPDVEWEATPTNLPTEVKFGDFRVDLSSMVSMGMSVENLTGELLQTTDDSVGVSFDGGATFGAQVRLENRCMEDDSLFVFASMLSVETQFPPSFDIRVRNDVTSGEQTTQVLSQNNPYVLKYTCSIDF